MNCLNVVSWIGCELCSHPRGRCRCSKPISSAWAYMDFGKWIRWVVVIGVLFFRRSASNWGSGLTTLNNDLRTVWSKIFHQTKKGAHCKGWISVGLERHSFYLIWWCDCSSKANALSMHPTLYGIFPFQYSSWALRSGPTLTRSKR